MDQSDGKDATCKAEGLMHSNHGRLTFCKACGEGVMHVCMNCDSSVSKETGCELDGHSSIPENSTKTFLFTTTQNEYEPTECHIKREVLVLSLWLKVAEV
jgi:hypothetical protein